VLTSKFSFPKKDGPNTWGASRYQMMQAVEDSLRGCKRITSIFIMPSLG
jgi:aryl-alcohol dehydrogenase-like predicted oxidoreductase